MAETNANTSVPDPAAAGPAPIAVSDRIVALDVLRGTALLGIVMVNIFTFALPLNDSFSPPAAGAPGSETVGYVIMRTFFQLKWMPIFSMLFGAGLAVQVARAAARNDAFVPRYLRRMSVLLVIGLLHAWLLWFGDILVWYAVIGLGLLLVRTVQPRRLITAGATVVVVGGLLSGTCTAVPTLLQNVAPPPVTETVAGADADAETESTAGLNGDAALAEDATAPRGFDAIVEADFDPAQPVWRDAELVAFREGPWIDAAAFRVVSWGFGLLFIPFGFGFIVFGCFLLGAGLLRSGFFDPSRVRDQGRLAAFALGIGLPLEAVCTAVVLWGGTGAFVIAEFVHGVTGPTMAVGLLAGITWLVSRGWTRGWDLPVRAAGRAALSVYLGETIIGTAIFHWWGLGLFGDVPRLQLLGIGALIWFALAVLAMAWLQVFRFGPAEWLWRSLTYGRPQPILRSPAPTTPVDVDPPGVGSDARADAGEDRQTP